VFFLSSPLENKVFKPFFQPANCGKFSVISLQSCECFCVICIIHCLQTTNHHNQAELWEYFRDFVAAMGMFPQVTLCLHNHTTRQNRGNISMISLQLWECFHESHCAYTTTLPGKLVGIFLRFRCSCGNVSASCVVLTQPHNQAQLWECFSTSRNTVFYFNMKELGHAI